MTTRLEHEKAHEQEGVIKYQLQFQEQAPSDNAFVKKLLDSNSLETGLIELNSSRHLLKKAGLMGQDPRRYGGDGFGNISIRIQGNVFLVSGSQTGHIEALSHRDVAVVNDFNVHLNKLSAFGLTKPSSESMTHGVCYQTVEKVGAVIHVHSPDIWQAIDDLELPYTDQSIPYGTPQMANAVRNLLLEHRPLSRPTIFGMKGHEDGVVVVGKSLTSCTTSLLDCLNQALLMRSS